MGKTVNKKKNIKQRRTIRRTVGALLMVTAITVAAIPIPETQAYNPANNDKIADYGTGAFVIRDLSESLMANCNVTDNYNGTAYTIAKAGGDWQLDWQFRYYSPSGGADGYIQYYNSQYQQKNVTLSYRVFSKYINIDGYYYIGQWNKDSFNGKGILYTENGSIRYEGEFIKNKFKGN